MSNIIDLNKDGEKELRDLLWYLSNTLDDYAIALQDMGDEMGELNPIELSSHTGLFQGITSHDLITIMAHYILTKEPLTDSKYT